MQVIAWRAVFEMTYDVSSGTLNPTHSLTPIFQPMEKISYFSVGVCTVHLFCSSQRKFFS